MAEEASIDEQSTMFIKEMVDDFNWPDIVIAGRQKRPRENISVGQKRELCQYQKDNPHCKQRALLEFCRTKWGINIGKSTVSDILRHKDKWLQMPEEAGNIYRLFSGRYARLEEQLIKWCNMMNSRFPNYKITDWMLKRQARVIGMRLNVDDTFGYSSGWIQRFKKRHGLVASKTNKEENNKETDEPVNSTIDTIDKNLSMNEHPESVPVHLFENEAKTLKASATITSSPDHDDNSPEAQNEIPMGITIKSECIEEEENSTTYEDYGSLDDSKNRPLDTTGEGTNEASIPQPPPLKLNPHIVSIQNSVVPVGEPVKTKNAKRNMERSPSPPEKRVKKNEHETSSLNSRPSRESSSTVTRKEARKGIITCIRFIERTPELAAHLETLWDVYEALENSE